MHTYHILCSVRTSDPEKIVFGRRHLILTQNDFESEIEYDSLFAPYLKKLISDKP